VESGDEFCDEREGLVIILNKWRKIGLRARPIFFGSFVADGIPEPPALNPGNRDPQAAAA
jgi:hypothetical protein